MQPKRLHEVHSGGGNSVPPDPKDRSFDVMAYQTLGRIVSHQDYDRVFDDSASIAERAEGIASLLGELGVEVATRGGQTIFDEEPQHITDGNKPQVIKDLVISIAHASEATDLMRESTRPNHRALKVQREIYEIYACPYLLIQRAEGLDRREKNALTTVLLGVTGAIPPPPREIAKIISKVRKELREHEAEND